MHTAQRVTPIATICKVCLLVIAFACIALMPFFLQLDMQALTTIANDYLITSPTQGTFLYLIAVAFLSACGIPRQLLALLGGYAFGIIWGTLWVSIGLTFGCSLGFFFARYFGRSFTQRFLQGRLACVERFLCHKPFAAAVALRIFPTGNNALSSLFAGITAINAPSFILGSALGYIPQSIIFTAVGSGIQMTTTENIGAGVILLLIAIALGGYSIYQYKKQSRSNTPCTT